jgi:hypothetical protein
MAHSIRYWYDLMVAEKETMANLQDLQPNIDNSQQLLTDLNTTSRVGVWRLLIWVVATMAYSFEVIFDLFKADLEEISKNSRFGTLPWYAKISKSFQYGDALTWDATLNDYTYSVNDDTKKIIKRVSALEAGPSVLLKVAKLSGTTPEKLTAPELAAYEAYLAERKPAGIVVNVISDDADLMKLYLNIKYDPLVMDSTGQYLATPGTYPVHEVIEAFISNLDFDGNLELCNLVDAVQEVEGVVSVYVTSASAKYALFGYVAFTERYNPNAGYLSIDPAFPLTSTITYTANV